MERKKLIPVLGFTIVVIVLLVIFAPKALEERAVTKLPDESALSRYDLAGKPSSIVLPRELNEISGLAMTDDGRLFAHNDENTAVSQIDFTTGAIVKRFFLGDATMTGDFEGIAIVGKRFFLASSQGDLYEFAEGADGANVPFQTHKTSLKGSQDVEGLCFDPKTNALLLACKEKPGKGYGDVKAVYAFSLTTMTLDDKPRFLLPLDRLAEGTKDGRFNPSGIEYNAASGTFFVIAAEGWSIAEIGSDGAVIAQTKLNRKFHKQAEGITFAPDNSLLISDEARDGDPTIARYPAR